MIKDTGGPAFPTYEFVQSHGQMIAVGGMTLRDYFAAHASEADIAPHLLGPWKDVVLTDYTGARYVANKTQTLLPQAQARYLFADAMLKARDQ